MKPCVKCGETDRYPSGACAPCMRASSRRWKAANRERHRAGSAKWQAENPDAHRAAGRAYGQRNAEVRAEYKRQWREANPEKHAGNEQARRARKASTGGTYTAAEWVALRESYGNRCLCCGRTDAPLTVDHVIPLSRGGANVISNIQQLCGRCNSTKGTSSTDYRPASEISA